MDHVGNGSVNHRRYSSMNRLVIKEPDGTDTDIWGYRRSPWRTVFSWTLYICTIFIARLVFHWMPHWHVRITRRRCSLREADVVLARDIHRRYWIHDVIVTTRDGRAVGSDGSHLLDTTQSVRFFIHKRLKYVWDWKSVTFEPIRGLDQYPCSEFYNSLPLTEIEVNNRTALYGPNEIEVKVTPVLVLLVKEGLNPFYVFQICSCTLWYLDNYYIYATCIIVMSAISLTVQLYETRNNEKMLRDTVVVKDAQTLVCRDGKNFVVMDTHNLVPGDIIELPRGGCTMHCDAALVAGNCIVNESMLTGESVPVTKTPLPNPLGLVPFSPTAAYRGSSGDNVPESGTNSDMDEPIDMKRHSRHILFCGTKVIQSRNFDKEPVTAVVVRTGFLTAKGEMVRSILFPKPIDIKFNTDAMKFIGVLASFAMIGFIYTIVIMVHRKISVGKMIIRSLDLITIVVPPALPVAMTIGIVFAQARLKKRGIFCISPTTINTCGGISVACFDKTGTLTEDGLDLWGVVPSRPDGSFAEVVKDPQRMEIGPLMESMATCHSLTLIEGQLCGDPLDLKMFQSVGWTLKDAAEDETTEFDMSVPTIVSRKQPDEDGSGKGQETQIGILRQFTFSSSLQRMSVIAKVSSRANFNVYVKGSPEVVQTICRKDTVPREFSTKLLDFTRRGYRVLALAHRPLKVSYSKAMRIPRHEVEFDLRFLGFLVMENRLKPETEAAIDELKEAMIRPVMVTGDNMLTALSVARDCSIIAETDKIVLVDARAAAEGDGALVEFHYAEDLQRPVNEISIVNQLALSATDRPLSASHVKILMLDHSDFHLAVSGRSWSVIKERCPQLIPKLVVKGSVFARFSPEQKAQVIEALQSVGYYVCMCGDGANDCGALKAAHAGISLSEAEASVASPFTSKVQNISCVPELIKEGRCALTTSFGTFKFMAGYSFTQFVSVLILYWLSANIADLQFLYVDLFIITTLGITYGYSAACTRLSVEKPSIRLLTVSMIASLALQWLLNAAFQLAGYLYVQAQPWYFLPPPPGNDVLHNTFANMAIFMVSAFQYIILAIVFSKSAPFRAPIYRNYIFVINLAVVFVVTTYISFNPFEKLRNFLTLIVFPSIYVNVILYSLVLGNFLASYLAEFVVDNVTLRRQMFRMKVALFPQLVDQVEYERIREEIQNNAGDWPPVIKSASVQDMRPEIFTDMGGALHSSQSAQDLLDYKEATTGTTHKNIDVLREEEED